MRDLAYLQFLAREYPSVKEATSEIVNLMAICSLPKGTEYFSVIFMESMKRLSIYSGLLPVSSVKRSRKHSDI